MIFRRRFSLIIFRHYSYMLILPIIHYCRHYDAFAYVFLSAIAFAADIYIYH